MEVNKRERPWVRRRIMNISMASLIACTRTVHRVRDAPHAVPAGAYIDVISYSQISNGSCERASKPERCV